MKDKSHRQRIEDELFYYYDERFQAKCIRDIIVLFGVGFLSVVTLIALIAGVFNIFS